ncbi:unnamed protein product, partial [Brachionus calyciflorus]
LVRGFDLEGEEDRGHSLNYLNECLIKGFNYSLNSSFKFYFHSVETSWPEDTIQTLENIYDAIILKTKRIGHGLGLIKLPWIYKYLISSQTPIEVCPASNQILGYVPDLRTHPAVNYYRSGVPIVIAGDDPGAFGYNELTVDYYLAFMSWGLDLSDLREIANNSIRFSSMSNENKVIGFQKFNLSWTNFIDRSYQKICRDQKEISSSVLIFKDLMPNYGPSSSETEINLYGSGFETAICEDIFCFFGEIKSSGKMVGIYHIKCMTPIIKIENSFKTVNYKILIGNITYQTQLNYTFLN